MSARVQKISDNPRHRHAAAEAARAIRAAIADPSSAGERSSTHIRRARPLGSTWLTMWSNLPGLILDQRAREYSHTLLPGWTYTPGEMRTEMIVDLEHFATTGEQPEIATR